MFTHWLRRASALIPLILAAALTACGGSSDNDEPAPEAPIELPPDPPLVQQGPGALLSGTFVKTLTAADITAALRSPESKVQEGLEPVYDVASYRLTYTTTDKHGAEVTASGLVSVPLKAADRPSPVLSYQHATTFHDAEAPANKVEPYEPPLVLASLGYIVVSPDYVGFGASKGAEHPYLTAEPTARAVVDMLVAALHWRRQNGVADNRQLFLVGYSEGGYATMAAHRALQLSGHALKAHLQAAVPGAGPYDVLATMDEHLKRVRAVSPTLGRWLDPERLAGMPDSVRAEVRRLLLRQMVPEDGDVRYQTLFLDRYLANERAAIAAEHSVHLGWAPEVPVHLFHGRGDLTVPFAAAESARDALQQAGASEVSLTECTTPRFGHLDCVPEYFRFAVERMGQLARDL